MEKETDKPKFDPDTSPQSEQNKKAARARGWKFNSSTGRYHDSEGIIADRYGQSLG